MKKKRSEKLAGPFTFEDMEGLIPIDANMKISAIEAIDNFFFKDASQLRSDLYEHQLIIANALNQKNIFSRDKLIKMVFEFFKDRPKEKVKQRIEKYFSAHSSEYILMLNKLFKQLSNPIGEHDTLVVIATQNEIEIDRAIDAVKSKTDRKCHFIVFDNYFAEDKDTSHAPQISQSLTNLSNRTDVSVARYEVPEFSNVGFAKKMASDLALFSQLKIDQFSPLFFTDAKVVNFEESGFLERLLAEIEKLNILAASMDYDYDVDSKKTFEGWKTRCQIQRRTKFHQLNTLKSSHHRLIGAAFAIYPDTFALFGGFEPYRHEDLHLSKLIRSSVNFKESHFPSTDPISQLNSAVEINPSKQIKALENENHPESEWFESEAFRKTRSGLRFDWRQLLSSKTGFTNPLLQEKLDVDSAASMIMGLFNDLMKIIENKRQNKVDLEAICCSFALALLDSGIKGLAIHLSNGAILRIPEELSVFLKNHNYSNGKVKTAQELRREIEKDKKRAHWSIIKISTQRDTLNYSHGEKLKWSKFKRIKTKVRSLFG